MKKMIFIIIICFSLLSPVMLFAGGIFDSSGNQNKETIQDRYNNLAAPGIIMLPSSGISSVPADTISRIENELARQLVNNGSFKPVRMQNWLLSTYNNKAGNPFVIINTIRQEQFTIPIQYIGKPYIYRNGRQYFFTFYVYRINNYYPIAIHRQFSSSESIRDMISSCIEEMNVRLSQPYQANKKRIVIDDFKLELFRLVRHSSGEFDHISTPFMERDGITLRTQDDFFSRTMGYILETTNLFNIMHLGDFNEFSNANISASSNLADYRIQGRIQLSDNECILFVDLIDIRTSVQVLSLRHILLAYSYNDIWNAYRQLSLQIIERICERDSYAIVPRLTATNRNFFANDMFIGRSVLENFVLEKGHHIIYTGNNFRLDDSTRSANTFYIILDNQVTIYRDAEGRRVWNLLNK